MDVQLHEGQIIDGRYRINAKIGRGGFATVYDAHHMQLDRPAALKVLDPISPGAVDTFRSRFLSEARIAANMDHPNVVRIFDFGFIDEDQPYLAMEKLEGCDLDTYLVTQKVLEPDRARKLFLPVLDALRVGHEKGIVHKDLKPSNLFLFKPGTPEERLVILDYGIARIADDDAPRLTQTGSYTGTPAYMPPEYIQQRIVAPTFDVYQFGLLYIEALVGEPVIKSPTSIGAMVAHVQGDHNVPDYLRQSELGQVLMQAIEIDHTQRFQNAGAFLGALRHVPAEDLPLPKPGGPRVVGIAFSTAESMQFSDGETLDSENNIPAVSTAQLEAGPSSEAESDTAPTDIESPIPTNVDAPVPVVAEATSTPPPKKKSNAMMYVVLGVVGLGVLSLVGCVVGGFAIANYYGDDAKSTFTTYAPPITSKPKTGSNVFINGKPSHLANLNLEGDPEVKKFTAYYTGANMIHALFIMAENYQRTAGKPGQWKPRKAVSKPSSVESLGNSGSQQLTQGLELDPANKRIDGPASDLIEALGPFMTDMTNIEVYFDGIGDQSDAKREKNHKALDKSYRNIKNKHRQLMHRLFDETAAHAERCRGEDDKYFAAVCGVVSSSVKLSKAALSGHRTKRTKDAMEKLRTDLGTLREIQTKDGPRLKKRFEANPAAISAVYEQGRDLLKDVESLQSRAVLETHERHDFINGAYYVVQRYSVARQFDKF